MPEKSVREMNKIERQHYSLAARTFRSTIIGALILGFVALVIGLGLFAYVLADNYIDDAYDLARNTEVILEKVVDVRPLANEVMTRYYAMTDEERAQIGQGEYRARFFGLIERPDYANAVSVLRDFLDSSDIEDIYIAMYDEKASAIVYIADADYDPDTACLPGVWERSNEKGIKKFLANKSGDLVYDIARTEKYGWIATSGVPVKDDEGEIVAFILADVSLANVANGMKSFLILYSVSMFILVNIVAIFMARHMKKKLVKPINSIAEAAENYVNDKRNGVAATDHFSKLNITTGDEVENLALTMADMEKDLADFEKNLTEVTAEKERVGTELALATRIQADMLPNIFPAFPDRDDFDIYATMDPAKEVGGDFYDYFLVDDDHLALVIADVSGKGVPAALFMMVSMILIHNHAMNGKSPKEVLEAVNAQICANNREEMFVTVWLGILDLRDGTLTAANAGHEYPIVKSANGAFELVKDRHGFVIGGMESAKYKEYELKLSPGAKLFVYTDGVAEATDADGNLFGTDRLLDSLNGVSGAMVKEIVGAVNGAIDEFVKDAPQFDDITMMCVHYIGKESEKVEQAREMTVEATVGNIPSVTDFVNEQLEALDCPMKAQMQIDVAIDELFGNIAQYAYNPETGPATVRVEVERDPLAVVITFIDHGKPYDPLSAEDPDTTLSAEDRKIGGLGVFLVKKTMDDVSYEYNEGKNVLRIKKHI